MSEASEGSVIDTVAGFFASALDRPSFAVTDSFFASGGDSLGAVDILSRVDETFQVELKLRDLLEAPTPLRFSITILRARAKAAGRDLASEIAALSAEDAARLVAHLQEQRR